MKPTKMRIRTSSTLIALMAMMQLSSCQENNYRLDVEAKDTDGNPVSSVKVITGKLVAANGVLPTLANAITVESDAANVEGKIRLEYKSLPEPDGTMSVYGNGYYTSCYSFDWKSPDGQVGMTRSAEIKAILKPIKNPIPMVYHYACGLKLDMLDHEYFFDIEMGEALPPNGNGRHADVSVVLKKLNQDASNNDEEVKVYQALIRFVKPLDGLIEFPSMPRDGAKGSALVSDHHAPDHDYSSAIDRKVGASSDKTAEEWNYLHSLSKTGYYFRVRTKTNDKGDIISSHYGKIYGPVSLVAATRKGRAAVASPGNMGLSISEVYFNPTPNDRNVECDTKTNLSEKRDSYGKPFRILRP